MGNANVSVVSERSDNRKGSWDMRSDVEVKADLE
jgi:hypothetical protein